MTQNQFTRTQMMMGKAAMDTLAQSHVAVFGIGGVGGYVAEVLARSGVGALDLYDNDRVSISNINRQIYALLSTVGRYKVDVASERIHDINPQCTVKGFTMFYLPENADEVDLSQYDYVVDCIDTVKAKLELVRRCHRLGVPLLSSMGAANKLDPTAFRVTDISGTTIDPLARIIRKKLRKEDIFHLKVVCSIEEPLPPIEKPEELLSPQPDAPRRDIPSSNAFVPAAAGLIAGGEVVKDLINRAGTMRL